MTHIERIVEVMAQHNSARAKLVSDQPAVFSKGNHHITGSVFTSAAIEQMVREIIPFRLLPFLTQEAAFSFQYQSARGSYFKVQCDRNLGVLKVTVISIVPPTGSTSQSSAGGSTANGGGSGAASEAARAATSQKPTSNSTPKPEPEPPPQTAPVQDGVYWAVKKKLYQDAREEKRSWDELTRYESPEVRQHWDGPQVILNPKWEASTYRIRSTRFQQIIDQLKKEGVISASDSPDFYNVLGEPSPELLKPIIHLERMKYEERLRDGRRVSIWEPDADAVKEQLLGLMSDTRLNEELPYDKQHYRNLTLNGDNCHLHVKYKIANDSFSIHFGSPGINNNMDRLSLAEVIHFFKLMRDGDIYTLEKTMKSPASSSSSVGCWPSLGAICLCVLAITFVSVVFGEATMGITILIVGSTSWWVYYDASTIGVKKGQMAGIANMSPLEWAIACALFWIIVFPIYLLARPKFKQINACFLCNLSKY